MADLTSRRSGLGTIQHIDRFDAAWQANLEPRIAEFLVAAGPELDAASRRDLVLDLIAIDIEYRWRRRRHSNGSGTADEHCVQASPTIHFIEDYVHQFPDLLADMPLPVDVIANEYRVRCRFGDKPAHESYVERFARQASELRRELSAIDAELAREEKHREARPAGDDVASLTSTHGQFVDADTASAAAAHSMKKGEYQNAIPERIGRYAIQRVLGEGSFGRVYAAHDTQLDRPVALKVPNRSLFESGVSVEAFLSEARTAAKLKHAGLVAVYDVQLQQDLPFIVQELIEGSNLGDWAKSQSLSREQIVRLMVKIVDAVGFAHRQGFVHRDLKPANILIDRDGHPHIADFGLAVHETVQRQRQGEVSGTPAYMPPEQVRGETHRLDGRSDLWSLGVILYELLVGKRPFQGEHRAELFDEICTRDPRPLRQLDPAIPKELERICLKSLSKRMADRYATATDLAEDLSMWRRSRRTAKLAAPRESRRGHRDTDTLPGPTPRSWRARVCYALQPAPYFHGRDTLRSGLVDWIWQPNAMERVIAIVAAGGTGKTCLVERVLVEVLNRTSAGLLVWSFYENPRTEEFLRTACEYFVGDVPEYSGGLLERLQTALGDGEPHLLILDGLERVQSEGVSGRPRGELEDPQLRRLLRWLAAGQGTRTRALVTTRFPLSDLHDWKGTGYRSEELENLDPSTSEAILRAWGVKGDAATLDSLGSQLGYHALSVAVLGSYLGRLWGGDASKAPSFDRGEQAALDPKAARLERILLHYARELSETERDLLARLSTFPRGVTTEFLGFLVEAGGSIAGALQGCSPARLRTILEQLRDLGLVFRYDTPQGMNFSAHPFLREYFRKLLASSQPEQIHEAVCSRLAARLDVKPSFQPMDRSMLDSYESLIEHTWLAGRRIEALGLYVNSFGYYEYLSKTMGENVRGLRIVTIFSEDGSVRNLAPTLTKSERWDLATDWGLYAKNLGDLATARQAFEVALAVSESNTRTA